MLHFQIFPSSLKSKKIGILEVPLNCEVSLSGTEYYIKYRRGYTNSCYPFFFLQNLKLKTEVIID